MTQENVNYPTTLPPAFRKLVIRSVVLPLALALLIGSVFVWQVARLLAVDAAVHHSDLVIGQAIEVEKMLVDMETGLRAYVITNQWQFMQPYTDASGKIDAGIANLRNLVALNLDQEQRVEILSRQANAWRSYAVDLKSQVGRGTEAQSVIATGRGKALMDSVRQEVSEIVDVETQLRDTQSSSAHHMAIGVVGGSIGLCIFFGFVLAYAARRQLFEVAATYTEALGVAERSEREKSQLLASERSARSSAEHASRMKDEFLATVSHELRTPLNAIMGWAQLLRSGPRDAATLERGLQTVERNARVQTQLIEDLLDMSSIISGKLRLDVQRIQPIAFIEAAINTVRPAADAKGIRIETTLDPKAAPVSGDINRMQQVIWNLLSNAVKFTPKGGKVQVVLERVNSHIEISVSDTGQGIKAEFLPFVFDRFRQADASSTRKYGGLGLGLAIVRQLVELHGGVVRVKSPGEGKGATFVVHLPLTAVHLPHEDEAERLHPAAPSAVEFRPDLKTLAGLKVLIVDDEEDARDLVKRVLETCDAEVLAAASADEALTIIAQSRPHVLVSDIGMPDVDGYQFLKKVRGMGAERGGAVPAIALTAFARSEDRTKSLLAGYQAHISKPVEPAELVAAVASVAGRIGSEN